MSLAGGLDECGDGEGKYYNINCPLPPGTGEGGYEVCFCLLYLALASMFCLFSFLFQIIDIDNYTLICEQTFFHSLGYT
jgi:hypothetical protein